MSEIDLIRKLEKLREVKPNKEWVNFTKQSILNSKGIVDEGPNISIWIKQFTPLTICLCLALTFGILYTSNTEENNTNNIVAESNESTTQFTASVIDMVEEEQEGVVAVIEEEEENIVIEEVIVADIIEEIDETEELSATVGVLKEIERIRQEVEICAEQEEYLTDEQKETCENMKNQLEIIDKFTAE
jgi:hypothetical protein